MAMPNQQPEGVPDAPVIPSSVTSLLEQLENGEFSHRHLTPAEIRTHAAELLRCLKDSEGK
jgi:hypothetical protein